MNNAELFEIGLIANSHFGRKLLWYSRQNNTRLPIRKVHVQDSNEGQSPIDGKGFSVRIAESQFYGGRVYFNSKLHQDVLDEASNQHRYSKGMNITSKNKLDMGVKGLGLKEVAGVVISWV